MQKDKFQAAILERSREPLVVDEVTLPEQLLAGQVLVKVRFSGICGAQLNEIEAAKGPDKFLPHLLGSNAITPYRGYQAGVDASLTEEFAGAAFRFGHSIVSANLEKTDELGNVIGTPVTLKDAFFQDPADFVIDSGADGLLRHLTNDLSNALDVHIVDDLRNFLFGPAAGLDLAAINLQRGRDLGLGTLNETRVALGLTPYASFADITSDAETAAALEAAGGRLELTTSRTFIPFDRGNSPDRRRRGLRVVRVDVQPETAAVGPLGDALAEHAARLRAEGALPPPRKKSRRR